MKTITLYRAMCTEEYTKTIHNQSFAWKNKCKFFAEELDFVVGRVKDGNFSNSSFKKDKYQHLIKFEICLVSEQNPFIQVSSKELMLNVRKQSLVKVVNIELINS